ncbi:MAG: hypothetical protein HOW73_45095 [Polyangiaceae bacterium]|nr:hypothetical protein [Polyangiaceae bacterium]
MTEATGRTHFTEHRTAAYLLFVIFAALELYPLAMKGEKDDFPLSPYGMFAENKDESTTITQAVAIADGAPDRPIPPRFLGTDEVLQAKATLANAARKKPSAIALCERIASRIAVDAEWASAANVEIRTVTYESIRYFDDPAAPPSKKRVHARCPVKR